MDGCSNIGIYNRETYFLEFIHKRQEMGLQQLGFGFAYDWLRENLGANRKGV